MSWSHSCCNSEECRNSPIGEGREDEEFLLQQITVANRLAAAELNKLRRGKKKPLVSYDHPDQSFLCLATRQARLVGVMWKCGMDSPGRASPQVIIFILSTKQSHRPSVK